MTDETIMKQIAVRLPAAVLDRIDAHAGRLKQAHPGMSVSRADALRALLLDGLTTAETQAQQTAPKGKATK